MMEDGTPCCQSRSNGRLEIRLNLSIRSVCCHVWQMEESGMPIRVYNGTVVTGSTVLEFNIMNHSCLNLTHFPHYRMMKASRRLT